MRDLSRYDISYTGIPVRAGLHYKTGKHYWWSSSLTRTDDGDGSCEVFYVEKVLLEK